MRIDPQKWKGTEMLNKGDIVTITDGSYSRSIINGESIHEVGLNAHNTQFKVVEVGCVFPIIDSFQPRYEPIATFNNTVIQAIDSGKVISIEERFLQLVPPKHKVMVDMDCVGGTIAGTIVEISDKLYKEIKRDSQS